MGVAEGETYEAGFQELFVWSEHQTPGRADTRSGTDSKFSSSCVGRAGGMIWTWFDCTTHAQTT